MRSSGLRGPVDAWNTVQDGNCFFDSLRIILQFGLGIRITNEILRAMVVQSLLQNTSVLENYGQLYHDARKAHNDEILEETRFMQGTIMLNQNQNQNQNQNRKWNLQKLYENLMNPRLYWGDTFALNFFQEKLNLTFLIIFHKKNSYRLHSFIHPRDRHRSYFALLSLKDKHYRPLSYQNKFLLTLDELPIPVLRQLRQR